MNISYFVCFFYLPKRYSYFFFVGKFLFTVNKVPFSVGMLNNELLGPIRNKTVSSLPDEAEKASQHPGARKLSESLSSPFLSLILASRCPKTSFRRSKSRYFRIFSPKPFFRENFFLKTRFKKRNRSEAGIGWSIETKVTAGL